MFLICVHAVAEVGPSLGAYNSSGSSRSWKVSAAVGVILASSVCSWRACVSALGAPGGSGTVSSISGGETRQFHPFLWSNDFFIQMSFSPHDSVIPNVFVQLFTQFFRNLVGRTCFSVLLSLPRARLSTFFESRMHAWLVLPGMIAVKPLRPGLTK